VARSRLLGAAGAAALLLLLPAAGFGATTFQVRNARGVPQSHVKIMHGPYLVGYTDAYGFASAPSVDVGDSVRVTRDPANTWPCSAPEGPVGVFYEVRDARTLHSVTLPQVLTLTYQPGLDPEERWLLTQINRERRAAGLVPLFASTVLNRTADSYAAHLVADGRSGHCALASPKVRAWDMGFPGDGISEVLGQAVSADRMVQGWLDSPSHRAAIMRPAARAVGVARNDRRWVATASGACLPDRCGMTGDAGGDQPQHGDLGAGPTRTRPWLRISRARRRGRVVTVEVELRRGDGVVRMAVLGGRRRPRVRWRVANTSYRFSVRLRPGRWRLEVRFKGRGRWPDATYVRRVRLR